MGFQSPSRSQPALITGSKGLSPMFMREEDSPGVRATTLYLPSPQKAKETTRAQKVDKRKATFKTAPSPHGSPLERLLYELEQDPERIGTAAAVLAEARDDDLVAHYDDDDGAKDDMADTMMTMMSLTPGPKKGKDTVRRRRRAAAAAGDGSGKSRLPGIIDSGRRRGGTSSWRPSPSQSKSKASPTFFTGRKEPRHATIRERRKKEDALERKRRGPRWIE